MQKNEDGSVTLSREELYGLVWTKPVLHVAKQFGLSDRGLAKACERSGIPRPGLGYWARLQHGKPARRVPLPMLDEGAPVEVTIKPEPQNNTTRTQVADELPTITVPAVLSDPHTMVVRTEKSLRAAKPDDEGLVMARAQQTLDVRVSPTTIDRAMRLCDALIKALEARSCTVRVEDPKAKERERQDRYCGYGQPPPPEMTPRRTFAVVDGEEIGFALAERVTRERRKLTPQELQLKEKRPWEFRPPPWTYTQTGRLCLQITTHVSGKGVHKWYDRSTRASVETKLGAFIVAATDTAAEVKRERAEAEEKARQREAWLKERSEKLDLIRKEEERLKGLYGAAEAWHESQRIRAYVEAFRNAVIAKHGVVQEGSEAAGWIAWASAQADRRDPLVKSPPSILDEKRKWEAWW